MALTAAEQLTQPDEEVWATTIRNLRAFVARRVAPAEADDITQDILIRILRSGRSAADAAATPAWLYTVARNAVIDHYRSRRIIEPLPYDFDARSDAPETQPPAALQEAALCLRPVVDTLPERYRRAVTMVDLDGLTHAAAARAEGLSLPGMKSRVQRGRRMLAARLQDWCSIYLDDTGRVATDGCACSCATEAC